MANTKTAAKLIALTFCNPLTSEADKLMCVAQLAKSALGTGFAIQYMMSDFKEQQAAELLKLMALPSLQAKHSLVGATA